MYCYLEAWQMQDESNLDLTIAFILTYSIFTPRDVTPQPLVYKWHLLTCVLSVSADEGLCGLIYLTLCYVHCSISSPFAMIYNVQIVLQIYTVIACGNSSNAKCVWQIWNVCSGLRIFHYWWWLQLYSLIIKIDQDMKENLIVAPYYVTLR